MASITTIIFPLCSLLFISSIFFTESIKDFIIKETYYSITKPRSAALLAVILASAIAYAGKSLSVRDLLSRVARTFARRFVSWFYLTLLQIGYTLFVLALLINLILISGRPIAAIAISLLGIPALVFHIYLSVVWQLAVMVTVIEESYCGIGALGKAGGLAKGNWLHGFALSFLFMVATVLMYLGFRIFTTKQSLPTNIIVELFMLSAIFVVKVFELVAYIVYYFQCKKIHGEEIELQGSREYTKVPTKPLAEDIP